MCLIVEKMREYQAQDPQLIAQVWETAKTQAPRLMQAKIRAGEDLIRTSIESPNKQLPSPISISAQQFPPTMSRSETAEVTNSSAKPSRKRKSHSKAALTVQAAEKSQKLTVQEGERVTDDVALTPASHSHSSRNAPGQTKKGPPHTH
jgi:hypothetical protein